jgi:hypothetical protein
MADTGARRGMPPGLGVAGMVGRPADRQDRPEAGARRLPASPASAPALNDLHRPGPLHASLDGLQVLIVDDHALFADGLAMLLGQLAPACASAWPRAARPRSPDPWPVRRPT